MTTKNKLLLKRVLWALSAVASIVLLTLSILNLIPEVGNYLAALGFITGGYSVWLLVVENIWTWPVSIANALIFIVLFYQQSLYADSGLQIVYIVLNITGWVWWLKGNHGGKAQISHIRVKEIILLVVLAAAASYGLYELLVSVKDSAPLLDAISTVLSLVATYMAVKKYIDNWYVWFVVNAIYIVLYVIKDQPLLVVLYGIYFVMTVVGLVDWQRQLNRLRGGAVMAGKVKPVP